MVISRPRFASALAGIRRHADMTGHDKADMTGHDKALHVSRKRGGQVPEVLDNPVRPILKQTRKLMLKFNDIQIYKHTKYTNTQNIRTHKTHKITGAQKSFFSLKSWQS